MEEKVKCLKAINDNPLPPNPKKSSEPLNVNSYVQVRALLDTDASDDIALAKLAIQGNANARITSYNVCYTKLLRTQSILW